MNQPSTPRRRFFLALILVIGMVVSAASCVSMEESSAPADSPYRNAAASALIDVPAGAFTMGSKSDHEWDGFTGDPDEGFSDEHPAHLVTLDAYRIEQTEVSNAQYRVCVAAGVCVDPIAESSRTRDAYYLDTAFDRYPVVSVSFDQAEDYCRWRGRRLPTEAEWEKAARGSADGRFPWGDSAPVCLRANLRIDDASYDDSGALVFEDGCYGDTTPVDDFDVGASPYGVLNMSGNVFEWTADRYASRYYDATIFPDNDDNPTGPSKGARRVIRGGSFASVPYLARASYRQGFLPTSTSSDLGFRCAADATTGE